MAGQANQPGDVGPGRRPPDTVLLDAFGTLLELEPPGPRLHRALARAGIAVSEEQAGTAFRAEIAYYLEHHLEGRDAVSLEGLRDACAEVVRLALGRSERDRAAVRAAMLEAIRFRAHPDAAPAMVKLRAAGSRLVVASNWDRSLPEVLERAGLHRLVDGVVTSAGVGAAKPDPGLFLAALAAVGGEPALAVHVGDSVEHDVEGALAAGVRPVLLSRGDRARVGPSGVATIASLGELPSLLFGGR